MLATAEIVCAESKMSRYRFCTLLPAALALIVAATPSAMLRTMHIPTDGEAPSVLVEYLEGMSIIPILNDVPRERTLRGRVGCRLPTCSLLHALRMYIVYSVSFVWARSGHVLRVSDATHLARVSNGDIASWLEGSILAILPDAYAVPGGMPTKGPGLVSTYMEWPTAPARAAWQAGFAAITARDPWSQRHPAWFLPRMSNCLPCHCPTRGCGYCPK